METLIPIVDIAVKFVVYFVVASAILFIVPKLLSGKQRSVLIENARDEYERQRRAQRNWLSNWVASRIEEYTGYRPNMHGDTEVIVSDILFAGVIDRYGTYSLHAHRRCTCGNWSEGSAVEGAEDVRRLVMSPTICNHD